MHALGGHFLQSSAWQRVQAALGQQVVQHRGESWAWAGPLRLGRFPRYLYLPYGPAAASLGDTFESLRNTARRHHLDFVRIEPLIADRADLVAAGAVAVHPVQPKFTWVLDLQRTEEELRAGLSAGHRGSINAAGRRGLELRATNDPAAIEVLLALQRTSTAGGGFPGQTAAYHRAEAKVLMPEGAATLYIAEHEAAPVAAALCFDWFGVRYYAHAASDPVAGRRLSAAAPLLWRMVLDARAAGQQSFDFWGVAPDAAPGHPWAGFTRFKMAFGGRLVERAGTWELPTRPLRHRLYRMARRR